jgi:hypothetical protein
VSSWDGFDGDRRAANWFPSASSAHLWRLFERRLPERGWRIRYEITSASRNPNCLGIYGDSGSQVTIFAPRDRQTLVADYEFVVGTDNRVRMSGTYDSNTGRFEGASEPFDAPLGMGGTHSVIESWKLEFMTPPGSTRGSLVGLAKLSSNEFGLGTCEFMLRGEGPGF